MKNALMIILAVSLLFLEGCSLVGYTIGKETYKEEQIAQNDLEVITEDSSLIITFKDNEVIEGKFRSCENDTLLVAFQTSEFQESNSNYSVFRLQMEQFCIKCQLEKIRTLIIRTGNKASTGFITGLLVDVIIVTLIINGIGSNIKPEISF